MSNQDKIWEVLSRSPVRNSKTLIDILLKNRGIKTAKDKKEFLNPTNPTKITLESIGVKVSEINKAIARIKKAKKNKEHVIVYGDYDADGITGTAIVWETLHALGIFVLPHIPERFSEGYGLNLESVKKLKDEDPKLGLIITVDHGITAGKKVAGVEKMGIDMIITDHHQKGREKTKPLALIYTDKIGGSALSWFFCREISKKFKLGKIEEKLQLAAIGTIADQIPLLGPNRSIVKFGIEELRKTQRPGLLALFAEARIEKSDAGPYEIGFMIAPRINSMGRLKHGLESLRMLCTKDLRKAHEIARNIGATNSERQRIVDEVVAHALSQTKGKGNQGVIVLASEKYHEGVIGLAAAKLVEEYYRPAIVLSKKGDVAKASARSIHGFNIIEAIRTLESLYIEGGGHPMAAGFSIKSSKIDLFTKKINSYAENLLTDEILSRKLRVDLEINFGQINDELMGMIREFEPTGLGNPTPTFMTEGVELVDAKTVGRQAKHLKLRLRQNEYIFDSIYFGGGEMYSDLVPTMNVSVAFQLEENIWNGMRTLQLKVKDLKLG